MGKAEQSRQHTAPGHRGSNSPRCNPPEVTGVCRESCGPVCLQPSKGTGGAFNCGSARAGFLPVTPPWYLPMTGLPSCNTLMRHFPALRTGGCKGQVSGRSRGRAGSPCGPSKRPELIGGREMQWVILEIFWKFPKISLPQIGAGKQILVCAI